MGDVEPKGRPRQYHAEADNVVAICSDLDADHVEEFMFDKVSGCFHVLIRDPTAISSSNTLE
jgi:hypothetical protein